VSAVQLRPCPVFNGCFCKKWVSGSSDQRFYFHYDGLGSTRQLASYSGGSLSVSDNYSYDGYGVLLQNNADVSSHPGKVSPQSTSLLYAGEQFDTNAQMYYLRARYYDQMNGRFNQIDPYAGNSQDPQSLHKYLYCHNNPVNHIDPSGKFAIGFNLPTIIALVAILATICLLYFIVWRPIVRPLIMMANSEPMPQEQIEAAVREMNRYWPRNAKMMELANGLSGDYPIYQFRVIAPESYSEGYHFLGRMYVNRRAVEDQNSLAVSLILFAEFQHYPAGGGLSEEEAQKEFIAVRRELPVNVRTPYINNLHHGGTQNEY
jgi:RHS repeat-associated protein